MSKALVSAALAATMLVACSKEPPAPAAPPPPPQAPAAPAVPPPPPANPHAAPPAPEGVAAGGTPGAAAGGEDGARAEADQIFRSRCAPCHGVVGAGDGPVAGALNPKPRSFGDGVWQKEVTDAYLEKVILEGGPAVGKAPIMPASPDLKDKPAVVQALRAIVRGFAK